jgi:hypothetical protein
MSGDQTQGAARPGKKVELPDNVKCTVDRTVEAVILYPSLGMPMVLGPQQNICSLIIATGKNCWKIEDAPEYIDRHLRLTAINEAKGLYAKNTESGELCGDGTRYQIAKGGC